MLKRSDTDKSRYITAMECKLVRFCLLYSCQLMLKCWEVEAFDRVTFADISYRLERGLMAIGTEDVYATTDRVFVEYLSV